MFFAYILDLHSKKIIGYKLGKEMTVDLVIEALEKAIYTQSPNKGLIIHTNLGTQYTSALFEEKLVKYGFIASFSKKGCPMIMPVLNLLTLH